MLNDVTLNGPLSVVSTDVNADIVLNNVRVEAGSTIDFDSSTINENITLTGTVLEPNPDTGNFGEIRFNSASVDAPVTYEDKTILEPIEFNGTVNTAQINFQAGGSISVPILFNSSEIRAPVLMGELEGLGQVTVNSSVLNASLTIVNSAIDAKVEINSAQVDAPITILGSTILAPVHVEGLLTVPVELVGVTVTEEQRFGED